MSEEHRALGYRPPPGSLAAMAQAAAAKHPDASAGVDPATLAQAALEDAKQIAAERSSNESASSHSSASSPDPTAQLHLNTISAPEARTLQSEEHKLLGHRPPAGSVAAQAQSVVDQRAQVPVSSFPLCANGLVSQLRVIVDDERAGRLARVAGAQGARIPSGERHHRIDCAEPR